MVFFASSFARPRKQRSCVGRASGVHEVNGARRVATRMGATIPPARPFSFLIPVNSEFKKLLLKRGRAPADIVSSQDPALPGRIRFLRSRARALASFCAEFEINCAYFKLVPLFALVPTGLMTFCKVKLLLAEQFKFVFTLTL